jgi:hypothetical protein
MLDRVGLGVVYDDYSVAGLSAALARAQVNFDSLRRAAEDNAPAWRQRHSADGFVTCLAQYAGWAP